MFETYTLNKRGKEKVKLYKETMAAAVKASAALMEDCREKSIFLTKAEEALFFGTKAIAKSPENHSGKQEH